MLADSASGGLALELVIVASIVIPLAALAVICWIFWKAKKRDDAERAGS